MANLRGGVPARQSSEPYPKPKKTGGRLVREVIRRLRAADVQLPISSDILIATSGGADSTALAHLLIKYGRRVADPARIQLLHVNHGWRGVESDGDEAFVRGLAKRWGMKVHVERLKALSRPGESWEAQARAARQKIFRSLGRARDVQILTAHHADDLAETLLWRLCTGAASTHGGGIALRHGCEVRPLLAVRKSELRTYLEEEGQAWREDRTNHEGRFLRSRMRKVLMPELEAVFPRAVEHLAKLALEAQAACGKQEKEASGPELLLGAASVAARRAQWEMIQDLPARPRSRGRVDLPNGWKLLFEKTQGRGERWVLENDEVR